MAEFTAREIEILIHAWKCLVEEAKIDFEKLAALCKMTNTKSAQNAWRAIRKKILSHTDGAPVLNSATKSSAKKRGFSATNNDDDEEGEALSRPNKKTKGGRKKAATRLLSPVIDSEAEGLDDEEIAVKREHIGGDEEDD